MFLKPRKRLGPPQMSLPRAAPEPAFCAFCRAALEVPPALAGPTDMHGSRCHQCLAICVADPTGKQGGEALMIALRSISDGDEDAALGLREGTDYECRALAWNQVANEVDPSVDASRYGVRRLWFFKRR